MEQIKLANEADIQNFIGKYLYKEPDDTKFMGIDDVVLEDHANADRLKNLLSLLGVGTETCLGTEEFVEAKVLGYTWKFEDYCVSITQFLSRMGDVFGHVSIYCDRACIVPFETGGVDFNGMYDQYNGRAADFITKDYTEEDVIKVLAMVKNDS